MSKIIEIKYEWAYNPESAIKVVLEFHSEYGEIHFENGRVSVAIETSNGKWDESFGSKLNSKVRSIVDGVSLIEHKVITLDGPSRVDTKSDGTKHFHLHVHDSVCLSSVESVELIVFDKEGNEISNSAEERKQKSVDFAILIDKYRDADEYLMKMLSSYYSSISDPDNEFVHLYEVRDTVSSLFKGSKEAMNTLNISKSRWDVLGKLANIEPLLEGRHRGSVKQGVELRRANTQELNMARECVVELIEKYLNYREQQNTLTKSSKATPKYGAL